MPRGQYDRSAAAVRRSAAPVMDDPVMMDTAPAPPIRAPKGRIDRGEDWGNRVRKVKGAIDYYNMAHGLQPSDAIYQWKTFSIYGQEQKDRQLLYSENGWSAVPADRAGHQHLPSVGNHIVHEGLMLMEQPIALYREARLEEERAHQEQLRTARRSVAETPSGQMDRTVATVSARNEVMTIDRE